MSKSSREDRLSSRVHLSRGASYLLMQTLGVNVLGVMAFAVVARLITTAEMGVWAILLLINATCITFATWFPSAVTKYVAENVPLGSRNTAAAAFYQALRANIFTYLPVIVGMFFGANFLASHLLGDASYTSMFQLLAFDVFLSAGLVSLATAALMGLRMFRETAIAGLVAGGIFRQLLIVSLVFLMRTLLGLVIGWLVSDAVLAGVLLILVAKALGGPRFDFPLIKLFRFYWPIELAQIVSYTQTWFDRVLLVIFVPLAALGVYNAAVTAFTALTAVSAALTNALLPAFSSLQNKEERTEMVSAVRLATRYSNLLLTPLAFGLLATAKPALTLFVGQAYAAGSLPLTILSVAFALVAFTTAMAPALTALEETKIVGGISAGSVLVGLLAAYFLLPAYGIVGAAASRGLSIFLAGVLIIPMIRRKLTFRLEFSSIMKTLVASSVMAAVVLALQLALYSRFLLPLYVIVGAMVYVTLLRLLNAVDKDDMELIRGLLGDRLKSVSRFLSWILVASN